MHTMFSKYEIKSDDLIKVGVNGWYFCCVTSNDVNLWELMLKQCYHVRGEIISWTSSLTTVVTLDNATQISTIIVQILEQTSWQIFTPSNINIVDTHVFLTFLLMLEWQLMESMELMELMEMEWKVLCWNHEPPSASFWTHEYRFIISLHKKLNNICFSNAPFRREEYSRDHWWV